MAFLQAPGIDCGRQSLVPEPTEERQKQPCAQGPARRSSPAPSAGSPHSVIHGFLSPFVPGGLLGWFGAEVAELMRVK